MTDKYTNYGIVRPELPFKIKKLHPDAKIPQRAHGFDAGLDLFSVEDRLISPGKIATISIGLALGLPNGFEAQIRPRSGLAAKYGIAVLNSPATIDSSYRGEVKVILINHSDSVYFVKSGDKIAQMVLAPVTFLPNIQIVEELDETDRGSGGFGSSGK